ncbi:MAG TPA: DUF3460 family protein [Burkholderiales bacterium]|jgi:hypothetical protein
MKNVRYRSEFTQFIDAFLECNPQVVEKQKRHRATWWDRPQDLTERERQEQAEVAPTGYAYYQNP